MSGSYFKYKYVYTGPYELPDGSTSIADIEVYSPVNLKGLNLAEVAKYRSGDYGVSEYLKSVMIGYGLDKDKTFYRVSSILENVPEDPRDVSKRVIHFNMKHLNKSYSIYESNGIFGL